MSKLIPVSKYRTLRFADRPPAASTIRRWIDAGDLPGRRIGGSYFVDLEAEARATGNSLADAILEAASR